jgi:hypothetical protein
MNKVKQFLLAALLLPFSAATPYVALAQLPTAWYVVAPCAGSLRACKTRTPPEFVMGLIQGPLEQEVAQANAACFRSGCNSPGNTISGAHAMPASAVAALCQAGLVFQGGAVCPGN